MVGMRLPAAMDGRLVTGEGAGATFVSATSEALAELVGFTPYPGTVNLAGVDGVDALPLRAVDDDLGDPHCEGLHLRPCTIGGVRSSVIRPLVPDYPPDKLELLAPVRIRDLFGFDDGAAVPLAPPDEPWRPNGPRAAPAAIDGFDAVVFDLDGTLVDLDVDWSAVHDEIEARFGDHLEKPVTEHSGNELFEVAEAQGVYEDLVGLIERHEREGAETAVNLPGVDHLASMTVPVGICTANAASAAERALEAAGARGAVDAIVARETVRPGKPDPAPLLECLHRLDVRSGDALFVGDQPGDAQAAAGAGTSFLHVDQLWPEAD